MNDREKKLIVCSRCGDTKCARFAVVHANNTIHHELRCIGCDAFFGYISKISTKTDDEIKADEFTFGKHRGKKILDVAKSDRGYLEWLLAQKDLKAGMRTKLEVALKMSLQGANA